MGVMINIGAWNSVFAVPKQVVDNDLKLAGIFQLKVLLFLLRNGGREFTPEQISTELSINIDDVKDSITFWVMRGLFTETDGSLLPGNRADKADFEEKKVPEEKATVKKPEPRKPVRPERPSPDFVAKRIDSDSGIAFLMQEAQTVLNRPISSGEIASLLMLHDTDGLPIDVLIMLLQFAKSEGKSNISYIEKTGIDWAQSEIFTIEKADERIKSIQNARDAWAVVKRTFGINESGSPSKNQVTCADRWLNEWHFSKEMVREAYELCLDTKGGYKLTYIDGILKKWYENSVFTPEDIKAFAAKGKKKEQKKEASYDIDAYEASSIFDT